MSTVAEVMRSVRQIVEDKRVSADRALEVFSQEVAQQARNLAPVRKMYSSKRKGARRRKGSNPSIELAEALYAGAQRAGYEMRQDTGYVEAGFHWENRNGAPVKVQDYRPTYRVINEPSKGVFRRRRNQANVDRRNNPSSKYRVLGSVYERKKTTRIVTQTAKLKKERGASNLRGAKPKASRDRPTTEVTTERVTTFRRRKGMNIDVTVEKGRSDELEIKSVNRVGKGILRNMNARQKYDVLHGRGLRIAQAGRAGRAKLVMGGTLRNSIEANRVRQFKHTVSTEVAYAKYVEFGTRYMAAQPYMTPALMKARHTMARRVASLMEG